MLVNKIGGIQDSRVHASDRTTGDEDDVTSRSRRPDQTYWFLLVSVPAAATERAPLTHFYDCDYRETTLIEW